MSHKIENVKTELRHRVRAETRFGRPRVVMGTAVDEEEFWRAVAQDEDLLSLGPGAPAKKRRAYFLTDKVVAARKGS